MPRPSKQPRLFDVANVTTVPGSKEQGYHALIMSKVIMSLPSKQPGLFVFDVADAENRNLFLGTFPPPPPSQVPVINA